MSSTLESDMDFKPIFEDGLAIKLDEFILEIYKGTRALPKSMDFLWRKSKDVLYFIEAKESVPPDTELPAIFEKFTSSLLFSVSASIGRDFPAHNSFSLLRDIVKDFKILKIKFVLIVKKESEKGQLEGFSNFWKKSSNAKKIGNLLGLPSLTSLVVSERQGTEMGLVQ
jgi:hypothetical protein